MCVLTTSAGLEDYRSGIAELGVSLMMYHSGFFDDVVSCSLMIPDNRRQ